MAKLVGLVNHPQRARAGHSVRSVHPAHLKVLTMLKVLKVLKRKGTQPVLQRETLLPILQPLRRVKLCCQGHCYLWERRQKAIHSAALMRRGKWLTLQLQMVLRWWCFLFRANIKKHPSNAK